VDILECGGGAGLIGWRLGLSALALAPRPAVVSQAYQPLCKPSLMILHWVEARLRGDRGGHRYLRPLERPGILPYIRFSNAVITNHLARMTGRYVVNVAPRSYLETCITQSSFAGYSKGAAALPPPCPLPVRPSGRVDSREERAILSDGFLGSGPERHRAYCMAETAEN